MRGTFSGKRFSHYDFYYQLGAGTRVGESYNLLGICVVVMVVRRGGGG